MKVAIANDHRGHKAIEEIRAIISQLGFTCVDLSTQNEQATDYPDSAFVAAKAVADKEADRAILVCGTGIGMCIAANKVKGIRAALCYDELAAGLSRQHNDANVLCLSGDLIGSTMLRKIVEAFDHGFHQRAASSASEKNSGHRRGQRPASDHVGSITQRRLSNHLSQAGGITRRPFFWMPHTEGSYASCGRPRGQGVSACESRRSNAIA